MAYAEIKAYRDIGAKGLYNGESASKFRNYWEIKYYIKEVKFMNDIRKARYKYGKLPIIFIKESEVFTNCIPFGDFNVDGYMVSNYGRVYNKKTNYMCALSQYSNGYMRAKLNTRDVLVHRLVLQSFDPNPLCDQLQVNHIDGCKYNNYLGNLEWTTRSENMIHVVNHGLLKIGENDHKSMHSNELVHSICKVLETNYCTNREVCQILNIPFSKRMNTLIDNIKGKREWKSISSLYNF